MAFPLRVQAVGSGGYAISVYSLEILEDAIWTTSITGYVSRASHSIMFSFVTLDTTLITIGRRSQKVDLREVQEHLSRNRNRRFLDYVVAVMNVTNVIRVWR
ncbi:hypothetical protein LSUB1_G001145 [Lachnellula subtilissima]|uniref:Uncharacterized protein n=1 Tax=Lachnellula subtilissima TaxID=602034 RepID=A0A8H8UG56_9HELO|nr:hypothetical protein LSUB1_G001145 [Lachnellula subtilissima]